MPSRELRRISRKKKEDKETTTVLQRNPVLYFLSIIVIAVIAVSFIGSTVIGQFGGGRRLVFGSYAGRDIEYRPNNYFSTQRERIAEQIQESGQGGTLESQLWQSWRFAFEQTVEHFAILDRAERSGMWVSYDQVTDSLVESGPYIVNGEFDDRKYEATPRVEKIAIRNLRRETLIHQQYIEDLFVTSRLRGVESEFLMGMASPERRFSFVSYSFEDFPVEETVSFGLANREQFQKIKLSRITVTSNRNEAEKVREMAVSGQGSFAELARSYSKGFYAEKGGDMGWQYRYQLETMFDSDAPVDALFGLQQGETSEVYPSGSSWVFFRCDSDIILPDFTEEDLLADVKSYVLENEKGVVETYFMQEAAAFGQTASEIGFAEASIQEGLFPTKETRYFPVNYMEVFSRKPVRTAESDEGILASAAGNEEFFQELFALEEGQISDPILLRDNIVVMIVRDERPLSEDDRTEMEPYLEYTVTASLDRDIRTLLVDEDKLVDDFQEAFFQYVMPRESE